MNSEHTSATMTYVMRLEAHLPNVSVLKRVHVSNLVILCCLVRLCLPSTALPSGFPTTILYTFLTPPRVLHAPPISS